MVELVLPFPPSANRYWRVFRGRPVLSAEAKLYKQIVARLGAGLPKLEGGNIHLHVVIFRPARSKRRDLDNNLKVLLDALQGVLYDNDLLISRITAEHWDTHPKSPRVEVKADRAYLEDGGREQVPLGWRQESVLALARSEMEALAKKGRDRERTKRAQRASP